MSATARPSTNRELRVGAEAIVAEALPAGNVTEALRRVLRDLPAIGKDQTAAPGQGGYSYRGIEQITRHAQGLFARHGIVFSPRVVHFEVKDITVGGKPWTDTIELVEYDVYGPGGVEDRITVGPILAIGRDNSDKGANKCMTQAFKYALLQVLCISDAKDDGDGQTHEAERPTPVAWNNNQAKQHLCTLLDGSTDDAAACWTYVSGDEAGAWDADWCEHAVDEWRGRPMTDAPAGEQEGDPT